MTIEYTLLVTIIGLIGYIILVINEAEKILEETEQSKNVTIGKLNVINNS